MNNENKNWKRGAEILARITENAWSEIQTLGANGSIEREEALRATLAIVERAERDVMMLSAFAVEA